MSATTTEANYIVRGLENVLLRLNLKLKKCRGQCYGGCSTMKGKNNGVVDQIKEKEPRILYNYCHAHLLNMTVSDIVKILKFLRAVTDPAFELTKLIKKSPKGDT